MKNLTLAEAYCDRVYEASAAEAAAAAARGASGGASPPALPGSGGGSPVPTPGLSSPVGLGAAPRSGAGGGAAAALLLKKGAVTAAAAAAAAGAGKPAAGAGPGGRLLLSLPAFMGSPSDIYTELLEAMMEVRGLLLRVWACVVLACSQHTLCTSVVWSVFG
jgi:hypothetical protein